MELRDELESAFCKAMNGKHGLAFAVGDEQWQLFPGPTETGLYKKKCKALKERLEGEELESYSWLKGWRDYYRLYWFDFVGLINLLERCFENKVDIQADPALFKEKYLSPLLTREGAAHIIIRDSNKKEYIDKTKEEKLINRMFDASAVALRDVRLNRRIQEATKNTGRRTAPKEKPLQAESGPGGISLDMRRKRLCVDARWFDVTEREAEMLDTLIKADGSWVGGKMTSSSRPDKTKSSINDKVGSDLIETHPRDGYRIPRLLPPV